MADKKKILFWPDVYKEQGHWLPTLAWADCLNSMKNSNAEKLFDIEYMGISDCEEIVKNFNTTSATNDENHVFPYKILFNNIYPYGYTNEVQTTPSNRWKPEHVWLLAYAGFNSSERKKLDLSEEENEEIENIRDFFHSCSPDLFISGYFTALETLMIYYAVPRSDHFHDKMKFAFSTTYLRHPSETPASRALQNLMAFNPDERKKLINIVYHGKLDEKYHLDDPEITLEKFVSPLNTFPEYIPCPKVFDYPHYVHGALVNYGEPCITKELNTIEDDSSDLPWNEILNKDKIIYVTAGSQVLDYMESALTLFMTMIGAMQSSDMKDYHLILCVGSTLIQNHWEEYDNVTVCGWAPQRQILQAIAAKEDKNSCAIIHGGLATIKECIYYEVPFLVLPLGKDQMDNALRLEDYGIKNRFHIEYIKPKCLRYFINQILQDYTSLLNLKKLSSIFRIMEAAHPTALNIAQYALKKTK